MLSLFTFLIVFVVFSVLILIHEFGHLFAAKKAGITVEAFSLGMGKRLFGFVIGGTDYRISAIPFGGFCKMAGENPLEAKGGPGEMLSKPVGYRFWVMVSGSLTNYIFAFLLFSAIFMMGVPTLTNLVGQVINDYPADKIGIKPGDRIVSINEVEIKYWDDLLGTIARSSKKGEKLKVEVDHAGTISTYDVEPLIVTDKNIFGQEISRPMLGVGPANEIIPVSYNPFQAVYQGGKRILQLTAMTYKMLWLILTGGVSAKSSLSGPVGIAYFIKEAAHLGIVPLLLVTAHISLALAIFNLLPFPVLDGGHVLFLAVEKLRGRPVSLKVQEIVTNIAVVILITFALFVTWQDIVRFTPIGKKHPPQESVEGAQGVKDVSGETGETAVPVSGE